jgi:flagellar protein FliS
MIKSNAQTPILGAPAKDAAMNQVAYAAYKNAEIETLSRRDLLVKLYEAAERNMAQAQLAMANKSLEMSHNSCLKAKAIFVELLSTLNFEQGGEIAIRLRALYVFFITRISEANLRKEPALLKELMPVVATLREGWQQIPAENANVSSVPDSNQGHSFNLKT